MKGFIKIVEVWKPDDEGRGLVLVDAIFGEEHAYFDKFKDITIAFGEGLPGKAWQESAPVLTNNLQGSPFVQKDSATSLGLVAGVAIPIYSGEFLTAVIVLLCGDNEQIGAVELWQSKVEEQQKCLVHGGGYYGSLQQLEQSSIRREFKPGDGLPGSVWDYRIPMLVEDMMNSSFFKRGGAASVAGISTAFAFPFSYFSGRDFVLCFLSSSTNPIAQRFEIWLPDREHKQLTLYAARCEKDDNYFNRRKGALINKDEGLLGRSWRIGMPLVSRDLLADQITTREDLYDLHSAISLPIIENGVLISLVLLSF